MSKKYALHSGIIQSRHDGENYSIEVENLINLYELKKEDCVIWDKLKFSNKKWDDYIHLFPIL